MERELQSTIEIAIYKVDSDKPLKILVARIQKSFATVPVGVLLLNSARQVEMATENPRKYLIVLTDVEAGQTVEPIAGKPIQELITLTNGERCHEIIQRWGEN